MKFIIDIQDIMESYSGIPLIPRWESGPHRSALVLEDIVLAILNNALSSSQSVVYSEYYDDIGDAIEEFYGAEISVEEHNQYYAETLSALEHMENNIPKVFATKLMENAYLDIEEILPAEATWLSSDTIMVISHNPKLENNGYITNPYVRESYITPDMTPEVEYEAPLGDLW